MEGSKQVAKRYIWERRSVKADDGTMLIEKGAVRKRWAEYFERLPNVKEDREPEIVAAGREQGVNVLGELKKAFITKEEVQESVREMKAGTAARSDGVEAECLKSDGTTVEWLVRLLNVWCPLTGQVCVWFHCIKVRELSMSVLVLGVCLLSIVGKVYGKVLIRRVREGTEGMIRDEQDGFRRGRGCVDQIFAVRQVCEKHLAKGKEVFRAFMDLEKAYNRIDRKGLWTVLRLYGLGGRLLKGVKSFYMNSRECVRVGNGVSDWFPA